MSFRLINSNTGLTLVETTVALGILMIGIIASLTLMIASFHYVERAEQEIVVVNLAREGIELVRALRSTEDGAAVIFDGANSDEQFIVDSDTNYAFNFNFAVTAPSVEQCTECNLYLNNGKYTHDSAGTPTIFKRMITLRDSGGNTSERTVISEVSWDVRGNNYKYTLEALLTNWQQGKDN